MLRAFFVQLSENRSLRNFAEQSSLGRRVSNRFVAGTEIRVRVEDALLLSHFGDEFREYQRTVSAYVPFIR